MLLKMLLGVFVVLPISNTIVANEVIRSNTVKISEEGKKFIEKFESRRDRVYICPGGKITGGIGHALSAAERAKYKLSADISRLVEQWFAADVAKAEKVVNNWVAVPLTQGQFDALVSFVFNLGQDNFKRSTLLKVLNKGKYLEAAEELLRWNKTRSKGRMRILPGLVARRQAERALFLDGIVPFVESLPL
jgi:lysozyme